MYKLCGYQIDSPLVNAAGSINGTNTELILRQVDTLADTAIGAITVGSFTVPAQAGNELKFGSPTYYHDKLTGSTYNSMGLPNIGIDAARLLMSEICRRAEDSGKPVIASVSPTLSSSENGGNTFQQVEQLVEQMLQTEADFIEVNTSCPSVVTESGGRKPILGYDLEAMEELLVTLEKTVAGEGFRLGLKLPPYINEEEIQIVPKLAYLFKRYRRVASFLVTTNAIPDQIPRDAAGMPILSVPGGAGGMSGPTTREIGREQLSMWHGLVGDDLEIISTLGLDSGKELAIRRDLGAVAAGGVTFLWESTNWKDAVTNLLSDFAQEI